MPELTPLQMILMWFAAGTGLVLGLVAIRRFRTKDQRAAEVEVQKAERDALRKAVSAGTHNERGQPLCRVCGQKDDPKTVATEYAYRVERDTGITQWVRERVGAPVRYRIGRGIDDDFAYCREHSALAEAEMRVYLFAFEAQRADQIRDAEVELAHFEKHGLDARLVARVADHERAVKRSDARPPAAKVVAIR